MVTLRNPARVVMERGWEHCVIWKRISRQTLGFTHAISIGLLKQWIATVKSSSVRSFQSGWVVEGTGAIVYDGQQTLLPMQRPRTISATEPPRWNWQERAELTELTQQKTMWNTSFLYWECRCIRPARRLSG